MALYLQAALRYARPRWHDTAYGTCIVIHHILCHHHLGDDGLPRETGYGLSTFTGDNEYDFLEVDFDTQQVRLRDDAGWFDKEKPFNPEAARIMRQWTFKKFCSAELGEQGELAYQALQKP